VIGPSPKLDDRTFDQLMEEALRRVAATAPGWTDFSPGDPGTTLMEVFAYLTETMLYRLNRLPEKVYVAFLNLLGVRLAPPSAATVKLEFRLPKPVAEAVRIPRGARVTTGRSGGEPPLFVTQEVATIPPGETRIEAMAINAELIEGEAAGLGTGAPGQSVTVQRPPIIASTGDELDLVIAVEAEANELGGQAPAIDFEGRPYRIWREVDSFASPRDDPHVYIADRATGTIVFAPALRLPSSGGGAGDPAALAATPASGRRIRVWYRRGGGPEGNVAAGTLTVLKDPSPGLDVTNPSPASGGRAAETLQNALVRAPHRLHTLERAVTADDYEAIARATSRSVVRAKAFARASMWTHAAPGTVEILLVPDVPEAMDGAGTSAARLAELESEEVRGLIQRQLDERKPLGTACVAGWARVKPVKVAMRVVARREEDTAALGHRLLERMRGAISPVPTRFNPEGWEFGEALRASTIYDIALGEPGVRWVDRVQLIVEDVPAGLISSLAADFLQPRTWYAGYGGAVFRTLNDGESWEKVAGFADEDVARILPHPARPGIVAAVTSRSGQKGSRIHFSDDCGEHWLPDPPATAFEIEDAAWTLRAGRPVLLLATDAGFFELPYGSVGPVEVLVDGKSAGRAAYAVTATPDGRIAVALQSLGGVFLSPNGESGSFELIGLTGEDVRVLDVQVDGPRTFIWAGTASAGGDDPGKGASRWEIRGDEAPPEGWRPFANGWGAGSCRAFAFDGAEVYAASHRGGVLRLSGENWIPSDVRCGLPLRDPGRFHPVDALATRPRLLMAGGPEGVFLTTDSGRSYRPVSRTTFEDRVTLPPTWLFTSGDHEIDVVSEDEVERD
jgi:hypothetical protein